jgi:ribokinase
LWPGWRGPARVVVWSMLCRVVIVVGDVCVDVLARPLEAVRPGTDTAATVRVRGGGAGANTAAWLAHLGTPVTLVARVGDDAAGRAQVEELRGYGVHCAVAVDPEAPTGAVVVLVGADGERTMLTDRGANASMSLRDIDAVSGNVCWDRHRHSRPAHRHLHLSGYTLLHEGSRAAGLAALDAARAAGMTTSVDPASAAPLAAAGVDRFLGWVRGVDLLLPNLPEALLLAGLDPAPDAAPAAGQDRSREAELDLARDAARALARNHGAVAVTLGARGALWATGRHEPTVELEHEPTVEHVPAVATSAVDTTGAGDAFTAGLLHARITLGLDGPAAVRHGIETAAVAVTRLGARPRA